jgi:hypothetical protein
MNYVGQVECMPVPAPLLANPFEVGPLSQQVTIDMLPDDVLLNIFRYYLDGTPRVWPTLSRVCQGWRQTVFASPLGLSLRLYCTYGTPVRKTLDYWPALPLVIRYGGLPELHPPAPKDDDNIIAALKQSSRVISIGLTITSSLLEKLSAISEPLSELEGLALLSRDNMELTLPSAFRWGPRLRLLHSTSIAFPSFPQLLSPCQDLVDLQIHEIPSAGYFSPVAFANALTGMAQLETLSLHFLSLPPRRNHLSLPPQSGGLPALTCLKYRGTSKYLDSFVARIDAPRLGDVDITFFSQPTMDTAELGRFMERIEIQSSLCQADIDAFADAISISFTDSSSSTPLRLQISCKQLDWQLSAMAQVCDHFSPFLFRVKRLYINTTQSSSGQDVDGEHWRGLVGSFGGARNMAWVAGEPTTDILRALSRADGGHTSDTTVLPSLRNLRVIMPVQIDEQFLGPFWDSAQSFITSRRLSGRPVELHLLCSLCDTSFTRQEGLKIHLVDKHAHRIVCSYCGDFDCEPGHRDLFREHLRSKHPEVARNDALISGPFIGASELRLLVTRHSSVRAPDVVASPTTATVTTPRSQLVGIPTPESEEIPVCPNRHHPSSRHLCDGPVPKDT